MNVKITQNMCRYLRNRAVDPEQRKLCHVFCKRHKKICMKIKYIYI